MITESHKLANRKWDKDNMRSVSCRLRTEDADRFKEWCRQHKTTPAAYLKMKVFECLDGNNGDQKNKDDK